jgi:hypothetical protein
MLTCSFRPSVRIPTTTLVPPLAAHGNERTLTLRYLSAGSKRGYLRRNPPQSVSQTQQPCRKRSILRAPDGTASLCSRPARAAALVHICSFVPGSRRFWQPRAGCLVCCAGHRVRLRVDYPRSRLCAISGAAMACSVLNKIEEVPNPRCIISPGRRY